MLLVSLFGLGESLGLVIRRTAVSNSNKMEFSVATGTINLNIARVIYSAVNLPTALALCKGKRKGRRRRGSSLSLSLCFPEWRWIFKFLSNKGWFCVRERRGCCWEKFVRIKERSDGYPIYHRMPNQFHGRLHIFPSNAEYGSRNVCLLLKVHLPRFESW